MRKLIKTKSIQWRIYISNFTVLLQYKHNNKTTLEMRRDIYNEIAQSDDKKVRWRLLLQFFSYVEAGRVESLESIYPVIFTRKAVLEAVSFELFDYLYFHVLYGVVRSVKMVSYCVGMVFMDDVVSVVSETGLNIVASLTYILN